MPRQEASDIFEMIKPIGESHATTSGGIFLQLCSALGFDPKLSIEIMGSFRRYGPISHCKDIQSSLMRYRGKETCGDIDILITRPTDDGKTHIGKWRSSYDERFRYSYTYFPGLLKRLLGELHRRGILTEDLCLPEDWSDLELVYRGLCRRDIQSRRRRIGTPAPSRSDNTFTRISKLLDCSLRIERGCLAILHSKCFFIGAVIDINPVTGR